MQVHFIGEEGVDEGGVQKEFFQLVLAAVLSPDYGMFTYDAETRLFWFAPAGAAMVDIKEYELIGTLVGLAIYNGRAAPRPTPTPFCTACIYIHDPHPLPVYPASEQTPSAPVRRAAPARAAPREPPRCGPHWG